ncbi:MAG: VOC family protein [Chryseolinea sp.]
MTEPIYPCLWFDGIAKEAAEFYCAVFKGSKITMENPMVVMFEANGGKFMCLNGGPQFKPNEANSYVIGCKDQQEIDYYWDKLTSNGGQESKCGWLKDKFGFSWQVIPSNIGQLMTDPVKGPKAMQELLKMTKIEVEKLKNPN